MQFTILSLVAFVGIFTFTNAQFCADTPNGCDYKQSFYAPVSTHHLFPIFETSRFDSDPNTAFFSALDRTSVAMERDARVERTITAVIMV